MDEAREGWHQRTPWFTGYETSVDCDGPAVPVRSSENSNLRSSCPKTTKRVVVVISYREAGVLRAAIRQLFLLLVIVYLLLSAVHTCDRHLSLRFNKGCCRAVLQGCVAGCVAGLCCDPASRRLVATPRRSQPSQLPCSAELATHHASTHSLHPNPLVCPDRSILTPQLTSAHIHAAISASQRALAPASRCPSTMPHTRCT